MITSIIIVILALINLSLVIFNYFTDDSWKLFELKNRLHQLDKKTNALNDNILDFQTNCASKQELELAVRGICGSLLDIRSNYATVLQFRCLESWFEDSRRPKISQAPVPPKSKRVIKKIKKQLDELS